MRNFKNFFLYSGLLVVLVLSASSISNGQGNGNDGNPPAGTNGCAHQDPTGIIDSGGNGSNNGIGGVDGPSCGGAQGAPAATPEPISMFLFGTGLVGVGVAARKRLRGDKDSE
jgi:hypothetical protein